jgi:hypothetical protein
MVLEDVRWVAPAHDSGCGGDECPTPDPLFVVNREPGRRWLLAESLLPRLRNLLDDQQVVLWIARSDEQ